MRRSTFPPLWMALQEAAGGRSQLQELLGATRSLLYQWATGSARPSGPAAVLIRLRAEQLGVESPV